MDGSIKIEFLDDDNFIIYYISDSLFRTEEEFKTFFKLLNRELELRYDYEFEGFYEVIIYYSDNVYILNFKLIDDFGTRDFDITMFLNSTILYEFEDMDLFDCDMVYYKEKFYTEIKNVASDIRLFEYGRVVYGKEVDDIIRQGMIIK